MPWPDCWRQGGPGGGGGGGGGGGHGRIGPLDPPLRDTDAALVKVEIEVIDKLDEMICEGRGDDEYKQLFTTMYVLSTGLIIAVR